MAILTHAKTYACSADYSKASIPTLSTLDGEPSKGSQIPAVKLAVNLVHRARGVYAGNDDSKAAWLAFRGINMATNRISKAVQQSPLSPAFRTIMFATRSPVVLKFDKRNCYCPHDEDVFEEDSEDDESKPSKAL